MKYEGYFRDIDDLIKKLDNLVDEETDPFWIAKYAGFLAVNITAILELSLHDILCDFATKKSSAFGNFLVAQLDQMNARISLKHIREFLTKLGKKYIKRFERNLKEKQKNSPRLDIASTYGNLITWRHSFAHEGKLPPNASYNEVKASFDSSKIILKCVFTALIR